MPIPADFTVEPATWEHDREAMEAIRREVFVVEQSVPEDEELDGLDAACRHALARDLDGRAIGTGRLTPDGIIGRMAVLREWRGRGVGEAILQLLLDQARGAGFPQIELHAQTHAVPFYEQSGFAPFGEEFDECGIRHRMMRLELAPMAPRTLPPLPPAPEARLLQAGDVAEARAAVLGLLRAARHELAIYTRDLDPALLDVAEVLDELRRVALSGRHARLRVIVHDAHSPVRDGHRLIALAQRLPSAIQIRVPSDERDLLYASAFLVTDARGCFFRTLASRPDGEGSTYDPGRHAQLVATFNEVWERSEPSEELRALGI